MNLADRLRLMPPGSLVPAEWVLAELEGESGIAANTGEAANRADLTLEQASEQVKRSVSTVRGWCASGAVAGAYKLNGRDWRIPPAALRNYLDAQASGAKANGPRTRAGRAPDVGGWRKLRKAG